MTSPHYIKAGWLIDGSGAPARKDLLLTVADGKISAMEPGSAAKHLDPAAVTDLSRCTILPPFCDCHAHLALSGTTDPLVRVGQLRANFATIRPRIAEHIHFFLSHGVLAVRDGGDQQGHVLRYKLEMAGQDQEPVAIKAAGRAWHKEGRYGKFIGRHLEGEESMAREIEGADHIKLINSGLNSLHEFGRETAPQFTVDEIKGIVRLAERGGKKVMVHANGRLPVESAIKAGCHSIEHGFFMGRDNLQRLADKEISWVPTAFTMQAYGDLLEPGDPRGSRDIARRNLEHQLEQLALARQYGVNVALGTDAGTIGVLHGESVVAELKLFIQAGYPLTEAVQCATSNGAKLLGLEDLGLIRRGRPAHFLVARATPAMLPRKLSYLEAIYLHGRPCPAAYFRKL
ncbi:MAG: amidohydrolase family protein [Thermodesulfobacteriota bacterium]